MDEVEFYLATQHLEDSEDVATDAGRRFRSRIKKEGKEKKMTKSVPGKTVSSRVEYFWLVYFSWDVNEPKPFNIAALHTLKDEIPDNWIGSALPDNIRMQKRLVPCLGGGFFSIYCKIAKGSKHLNLRFKVIY